jgi:hypothetical protein
MSNRTPRRAAHDNERAHSRTEENAAAARQLAGGGANPKPGGSSLAWASVWNDP